VKRDGPEFGKADIENLLAVLEVFTKAFYVLVPAELADLGFHLFDRSAVIEVATVGKANAIPRKDVDEVDVVFALLSEEFEKLIKEKLGGDDGRAGVVDERAEFGLPVVLVSAPAELVLFI
jgi:hypothetical protein